VQQRELRVDHLAGGVADKAGKPYLRDGGMPIFREIQGGDLLTLLTEGFPRISEIGQVIAILKRTGNFEWLLEDRSEP
jgi:hypothetical protein